MYRGISGGLGEGAQDFDIPGRGKLYRGVSGGLPILLINCYVFTSINVIIILLIVQVAERMVAAEGHLHLHVFLYSHYYSYRLNVYFNFGKKCFFDF